MASGGFLCIVRLGFRRARLALLLAPVLLGASDCPGATQPPPWCQTNYDCYQSYGRCVNHYCVTSFNGDCYSDTDCGPGFTCAYSQGGICIPQVYYYDFSYPQPDLSYVYQGDW